MSGDATPPRQLENGNEAEEQDEEQDMELMRMLDDAWNAQDLDTSAMHFPLLGALKAGPAR